MSLKIEDLFSVRGKVALITGGATGIGYMIAQGLVENGAKVYIASRKLEACEKAAKALSAHGRCIPLAGDVSNVESLTTLAAAIAKREKKLHILVNNAGAGWVERLEDHSERGWDKVMAVNVKAPFFLTQQLLPQLRAAATPEDPARIINLGSIMGVMSQHVTNNYVYSTSKAAVHHISRLLAGRLSADCITVNALAPGPFPSLMMDSSGLLDRMVADVPLGRAGTPEDIAGTVLYLCSRAGAYISGVVLPIDGGNLINNFNDPS